MNQVVVDDADRREMDTLADLAFSFLHRPAVIERYGQFDKQHAIRLGFLHWLYSTGAISEFCDYDEPRVTSPDRQRLLDIVNKNCTCGEQPNGMYQSCFGHWDLNRPLCIVHLEFYRWLNKRQRIEYEVVA